MTHARRQRKLPSRGHTIMEATAGLAVLAIAMTSAIQGLRMTTKAQQISEERAVALQVAENVLEMVTAAPALHTGTYDKATIDRETQSVLRDGRADIQVKQLSDDASSRIVTLEIHWTRRDGVAARPVRLTTIIDENSSPANSMAAEEGGQS